MRFLTLAIIPAVLLSTLAFPDLVAAEPPIDSHLLEQSRVTRVATALNHVSIIQLPEPILSAAIGSDGIRMEWHDNRVLIQPLKPGVTTNLFVWTARTRTSYEILPAGDAAHMSYLIDEVFPSPPLPPPGPSAEEVQKATDTLVSHALLSTHNIDRKVRVRKHHVSIQIHTITEDDRSYYVHLSALNQSARPYRIGELRVDFIQPIFSTAPPEKHLYSQISDGVLDSFGMYSSHPLQTHGSTLAVHDLLPGHDIYWVVAISKPAKTPGIFRFYFQTETKEAENVHAVAIF
jgi:hypothetical protein